MVSRIEGPSHRVIQRRGDEYAARFVAAIRDTLRTVTAGFHGVVTLDDLTPIMREWKRRLDNGLVADVGQAYADTAHTTRVAQRDELMKLLVNETLVAAATGSGDTFEIPPVSNQRAEDLMSTARNRLVNVGNDVWEHARGELLTGLQNGEGIPQLRDRVVGSTDLSARRAETIARTEIAGAMNAGSLDQMRHIGAAGLTQEWIAVMDARTRPEHAAMNGLKIGINEAFRIGEPGDEVNCRCTLGFDIPDDEFVLSACDCSEGEAPLLASALVASVDMGKDLSSVCACTPSIDAASDLRLSIESGERSRTQIGLSAVSRVVQNDGKETIVRRTSSAHEQASHVVADRLGTSVPRTIRHNGEFYQEVIRGDVAAIHDSKVIEKIAKGEASFDDYTRATQDLRNAITSSDGRGLGIFDYLTGQSDRHKSNWIITDTQQVVGIDHDLSFGKTISPFAEHWSTQTFTHTEALDILIKVESTKDYFTTNGLTSEFNEMKRRAQYVVDHGKFDDTVIVKNKLSADGTPL
jgi:SPP1 gp7 family putative phage head morphogenesis protein